MSQQYIGPNKVIKLRNSIKHLDVVLSGPEAEEGMRRRARRRVDLQSNLLGKMKLSADALKMLTAAFTNCSA